MGVRTTADERLDSARENLSKTIDDLKDFLYPKTWGHEDYNKDFIDEVDLILFKLLKLKRQLK